MLEYFEVEQEILIYFFTNRRLLIILEKYLRCETLELGRKRMKSAGKTQFKGRDFAGVEKVFQTKNEEKNKTEGKRKIMSDKKNRFSRASVQIMMRFSVEDFPHFFQGFSSNGEKKELALFTYLQQH